MMSLAIACGPKHNYKVVAVGFDPNRSIAEQIAEDKFRPLTTALLFEAVRYGNMSIIPQWYGPSFSSGQGAAGEDKLVSATLVGYNSTWYGISATIELFEAGEFGNCQSLCDEEVELQQEAARMRLPLPPPKDDYEAWSQDMDSIMYASEHVLKYYDRLPAGGCRIEEVSLSDSRPRYIYIRPLPGNPLFTVRLKYDVPIEEWTRSDVNKVAEHLFKMLTVTE